LRYQPLGSCSVLGWVEHKRPFPNRGRIANFDLLPTLPEQVFARSRCETLHARRIEQACGRLQRNELHGNFLAGPLRHRSPNGPSGGDEGHLAKRKPLKTRTIFVGQRLLGWRI
jgi:hypothetical protein